MPVFRSGRRIGYYFGDLLSRQEVIERYGYHAAPYALEAGNDTQYIDPACNRCPLSFANSRASAQCNARFASRATVVAGETRVAVMATRNVFHGDEIFIDYGANYGSLAGEAGCSHSTR